MIKRKEFVRADQYGDASLLGDLLNYMAEEFGLINSGNNLYVNEDKKSGLAFSVGTSSYSMLYATPIRGGVEESTNTRRGTQISLTSYGDRCIRLNYVKSSSGLMFGFSPYNAGGSKKLHYGIVKAKDVITNEDYDVILTTTPGLLNQLCYVSDKVADIPIGTAGQYLEYTFSNTSTKWIQLLAMFFPQHELLASGFYHTFHNPKTDSGIIEVNGARYAISERNTETATTQPQFAMKLD